MQIQKQKVSSKILGCADDMVSLLIKLKKRSDALSIFLRGKLPDETCRALAKYKGSGLVSGLLKKTILQDLDQIVKRYPIFDAKRFKGVILQLETEELLAKNPSGEELIRLNRRLLHDAYRLDIPWDCQDDQPWQKIGDEEIYIMNPLYRLCNTEADYVRAYGVQGLVSEHLHRAVAVVLALCNGKRTIADIAKTTRPLVRRIADDAKAIEIAKTNIKIIMYNMCLTQEERKGGSKGLLPLGNDFPAAVLMTKADYDKWFGRTIYRPVVYRARDFLPNNESRTSLPHFENHHYASPMSLNWHFTSDCSTNCRYCYLGRRKVMPMRKERTLSLIKEAADIGVVSILVNGGDIFRYPHLNDVLSALCKHNFLPVSLCSKSYIGKDKAKMLANFASIVLCVQFSIDSTFDDVADFLVGRKGFCDRIYRSINNVLEAGLRVEAKAVITPYNILTIPKLFLDLKKRGVSVIRLASYCRSGFHHSDDLFNHAVSYKWLEEQMQQLRQEYPNDLFDIQNGAPRLKPLLPEDRQKAWPKRNNCTAGRESMMICTDGKVIPCEQMPEIEEYFCGDVSHQSIQEVWDSDRLREITYGMPREKFRGQPCYDCGEWEECICQRGCCIRDLAAHHGSIYQPPVDCPKYNRSHIRMT